MKVQVLQVRTASKGFRVAHVRAGDYYGDVPAGEGVTCGGQGFLKTTLNVIKGRLQASLKVERITE